MNYKDNRIKMAMANVEQKYNVLKEARDAHSDAIKKAAQVIESVFIEKVAKPGEIIRTIRGNKIFYFDHIEAGAFGFIEVVCHPQKKDGTPSLAIRKMSVSEFAEI